MDIFNGRSNSPNEPYAKFENLHEFRYALTVYNSKSIKDQLKRTGYTFQPGTFSWRKEVFGSKNSIQPLIIEIKALEKLDVVALKDDNLAQVLWNLKQFGE